MKNKLIYYLKKLRTPLFILSMTLSIIGSYQLYHGQYNSLYKEITVIIISIMKLFTFFPTNGLLAEAPLAYELAIWMAPLSTMVGIFSVFEKLYKTVRLSLYHLGRDHIVVMGGNEEAITFIKNLKRNYPAKRVYSLLAEEDKVNEDRLEELDVMIVRLDYSDPTNPVNILTVKDHKIGDSGYIISFEEEPESYGKVSALNEMFEELPSRIKMYVKSENYRIKELVELKMDELRSFDIHYFNIEELLVKDLLENSNFKFNLPEKMNQSFEDLQFEKMEDIADNIGSYNILIIGFSNIAEQFLNQVSNILTINPLEDLTVTIIDTNVEKKFDRYNDYKTLIHKVMETKLVDIRANREISSLVKEFHKERPFQGVLFAHENPLENIVNIDRVIDFVTDVPVAIYAKDLNSLKTIIESLRLRHNDLTVFGSSKQVLNKDIIINEDLYKKAKDFNAYYNYVASDLMGWEKPTQSVESQWNTLSNIKKESSVYQTAHQNTKKLLLNKFCEVKGFSTNLRGVISNWKERILGFSVAGKVDIIEKDPFMNFMTALEHKRWNNFYYMRDFVFDEIKDEKRKTHDCLIDDWEIFMNSKQRDKAIYDFLSTLSIEDNEEE